jgi:hypothetical protein
MGGVMGGGDGMMGMMMGGGTGSVGNALGSVRSGTITAVQPQNSGRVMAHSTRSGAWKPFRLPEGVKAAPIIANDTLALRLEGDNITKVAAFSAKHGEWSTCPLKEAASGQVTPLITDGLVVYPIGNRVYAFSVESHRWGVLELDAPAQPTLEAHRVLVETGDKLCVFSDSTGQWAVLDLTQAERPEAE